MLIVEGPDGSGKSTLVGRLVGDLGWPVASKVVDSNTKANTDLVAWVENNIRFGLTKTIFDRHRLISEPIYGPLLRGDMEPGFDDFRWLRQMQYQLRWLNPLVVFCLPPLDEVEKNLDGDINNQVITPIIRPMYWSYFNVAASWGVDALVWDYTKTNYPQLLADIKAWSFSKGLHP